MTRSPALALVVGAALALGGCGDTGLSRDDARRLPTNETLSLLCGGTPRLPADHQRDLRDRAERLVEEAERRPDARLDRTEIAPHADDTSETVTVRRLPQDQLADLRRSDCEPGLQRRLRAALD